MREENSIYIILLSLDKIVEAVDKIGETNFTLIIVLLIVLAAKYKPKSS